MGRILFKYIGKEIITPFALGLFITTFVVFMFQILKLADLVVNFGVGLLDVGKILAFSLPPLFVFTIPMAFLLGVMLAVNRLSGDSELTAMKASGVSLYQMLPPVMALAFIAMCFTYGLTLYGEPIGKQSIKKLLIELGQQKAGLSMISDRVFITEFEGLVIYIDKFDPSSGSVKGVFISDEQQEKVRNIVTAEKGRLVQMPETGRVLLKLENGAIHMADTESDRYEITSFGSMERLLDLTALKKAGIKTEYHELGMGELKAHIARLKLEEGESFDYRRAWVEYHRRFAFPFSILIFGLVALPLGVSPPRSGKSRGFSVAIAVMCVFYLLFRVGENMGWKGVAHPIIAMWAPNLIFAVLGFVLLYKKANEAPIKSMEYISFWADRLKKAIAGRFFKDAKSGREGGE